MRLSRSLKKGGEGGGGDGCVVSFSLNLDLSDCLEYVLVLVMR